MSTGGRREPVITIDGPAGAGKSTAARELARRLGYRLLDTGAMYRALAWAVREAGIPAEDGPALRALLEQTRSQITARKAFEAAVTDPARLGDRLRVKRGCAPVISLFLLENCVIRERHLPPAPFVDARDLLERLFEVLAR